LFAEINISSLRVKPTKTGYSLPELLITILLLSILFTLAIIFSSGMSQSKRLGDYSTAVAFAQQAVEIVKASPFSLLDDVDAGANSVETDLNTNSGTQDHFVPVFESGSIKFERKVIIEDVTAAQDNERPIGMKLLTVEVNWKTLEGAKAEPFIIKTTIADMN
jgi:prepilin-type N-terminal cleavage/methylation domain-containing protein